MKKLIIIIIFITIGLLIKIPEYEELNNLAIINTIAINNKNNKTTIILKEIVPKKNDNGIDYDYIYYKSTSSSIDKALVNIKSKTKKKIYLQKCKYLILDKTTSDTIINRLNIKPKYIIHTNKDINKYIKRDYY